MSWQAMKKLPRRSWRYRMMLAGIGGVCVLLAYAGCSRSANPFVDDLPDTGQVTTASVQGVREASAEPSIRHSKPLEEGEKVIVSPQDGTVAHWPMYWQDPFQDKGSEDGQYAWTWVDYFGIPYGMGRFLLNTMAFPASVAVTPPWTTMGSDGELSRQALGYDHDASRLPGGTAPPVDVIEVGSEADTEQEEPAED